jgi:hypothetical protein
MWCMLVYVCACWCWWQWLCVGWVLTHLVVVSIYCVRLRACLHMCLCMYMCESACVWMWLWFNACVCVSKYVWNKCFEEISCWMRLSNSKVSNYIFFRIMFFDIFTRCPFELSWDHWPLVNCWFLIRRKMDDEWVQFISVKLSAD